MSPKMPTGKVPQSSAGDSIRAMKQASARKSAKQASKGSASTTSSASGSESAIAPRDGHKRDGPRHDLAPTFANSGGTDAANPANASVHPPAPPLPPTPAGAMGQTTSEETKATTTGQAVDN